jgi:adenylate cyclase
MAWPFLPRGGGPRARRLVAALARRERVPRGRRPAFDRALVAALSHRRAIVYTDTADFTKRSARDGIVHFLMAFSRVVKALRPAIAARGGRLVKIEADSLLLLFPDARRACAAVKAMDAALARVNRGLPPDERQRFSYGVGQGEVLELEHDVFGLEVNLASKLGEDTARPGEVLLTPAAREGLSPALRRRLVRRGSVSFTGRPLPVYRLPLPRS